MLTLHLHLQDGFAGEPVEVRVDGRTAWEKAQVRTRPQLGLADAIELQVPRGEVSVEVRLAGRDAQACAVTLDAARTPFLGVSLDAEGRLVHKLSPDTFGYV